MSATLVYNSKTITLTKTFYRYQPDPIGEALVNMSASGLVETLNVKAEERVSIGWRNFDTRVAADATLKRNLKQFFQWAREGNTWTLALDSTKTANTTLTSSNAAGDTVIHLTSTTGMTAGDLCVIRSKTHMELVKILTVDSGIQVTLVETLNNAYATGSRFRAELYWPGRLVTNQNPVIEIPPLFYGLELEFKEDVNSL